MILASPGNFKRALEGPEDASEDAGEDARKPAVGTGTGGRRMPCRTRHFAAEPARATAAAACDARPITGSSTHRPHPPGAERSASPSGSSMITLSSQRPSL